MPKVKTRYIPSEHVPGKHNIPPGTQAPANTTSYKKQRSFKRQPDRTKTN